MGPLDPRYDAVEKSQSERKTQMEVSIVVKAEEVLCTEVPPGAERDSIRDELYRIAKRYRWDPRLDVLVSRGGDTIAANPRAVLAAARIGTEGYPL